MSFSLGELKRNELLELGEPGLNIAHFQSPEAFDAEILDGERSRDAAVDRGPADRRSPEVPDFV
jgi:hypothetical protein